MSDLNETRFLDNQPEVPFEDSGSYQPILRPIHGHTVISDKEGLPYGRYIALHSLDIPKHYKEFAAVFADGESSICLLLADTKSESHEAFDLRNRLAQSKLKLSREDLATFEIIKIAHENHEQSDIDKTEVEKAAHQLINEAYEMGASDIHIETRTTVAQVYFRIDGTRIKIRQYSMKSAIAICSVLYNIHADSSAKTKDWSDSEILDTVIPHKPENGEPIQIRFNSGPIYPSGNIQSVMRLAGENSVRSLEELDYTQAQIDAAEDLIVGSQGMVILVGPTNSGKTTTMHALIERIMDLRGPGTKVTTIERPVESVLPKATQVSVSDSRESASCESALLATFRQDPDVIMFGEMQERTAAEHVKNLVLAGRKLLTTLHVFEVFAVFARLRELGVPDSVLFMPRFISGVVYQRLLPKLCPHCRVDLADNNALNQLRKNTYKRLMSAVPEVGANVKVKGAGCRHCFHTGHKGRVPCLEMLIPDGKFLDLLRRGDETGARNYWLTSHKELDIGGRGPTAMSHAVHRMMQGQVSPGDIEIFLGPIIIEKPAQPEMEQGAAL